MFNLNKLISKRGYEKAIEKLNFRIKILDEIIKFLNPLIVTVMALIALIAGYESEELHLSGDPIVITVVCLVLIWMIIVLYRTSVVKEEELKYDFNNRCKSILKSIKELEVYNEGIKCRYHNVYFIYKSKSECVEIVLKVDELKYILFNSYNKEYISGSWDGEVYSLCNLVDELIEIRVREEANKSKKEAEEIEKIYKK